MQVATYDVGGTQSMQQSSLSAHGSNTNDVSYNIDGATVNWPGGGGGATMMYYDQGMFEEVNYMTSAIPAEMLAGGVSINMVTKDGGNQWRGNVRYNFSNDSLQSENWADVQQTCADLPRQPDQEDLRLQPVRRRRHRPEPGVGQRHHPQVGRRTSWSMRRNADGSQALDDNDLKNYSGKVVGAGDAEQQGRRVATSGTTRFAATAATATTRIPDIASVVQTNPVQTTQAKYTGIRGRMVFESNFSVMDGQTNYTYQPDTAAERDPHTIDTGTTRGLLRVESRRAPAELAPSVRQRLLLRQDRTGRRAPVQGRRAVGPAVLRVATTRCVAITGWSTTTTCPTAVRQFNSPSVLEERRPR